MNKGKIVQVMGPVVDVAFTGGVLPEIREALEVRLDGRHQVMEVAQHVGGDTVRCITLSPSEGLGRGMEVTATGAPISVPVGDGVLGRMFNVLGDAIDEKGPVNTGETWSIHRQPPTFENQRPVAPPVCWAISMTWRLPSSRTSRASLISGSTPPGKATSTTGPMTCTMVP